MGVRDDRKLSINPVFFREIKDDRHELALIVERLSELTGDPQTPAHHQPEFIQLLGDFRDQLAFHFALEEAYGYFEEALDVAPHLHREAQRLRAQHADLYEKAQQLAEAADARPLLNIDTVLTRTETLMHELEEHETAEATLILSAMQDDLGGGD